MYDLEKLLGRPFPGKHWRVVCTNKKLHQELNLESTAKSINECKILLVHGPMAHFTYNCGTYVAAPTQTTSCCECDAPVHVLAGVMYQHSYGECTACHAKRCFACVQLYANELNSFLAVKLPSKVARVGRRCRACGAEPASVTITTSSSGSINMAIGERVATKKPASVDGFQRATGESASPTGSPPSKKERRKK